MISSQTNLRTIQELEAAFDHVHVMHPYIMNAMDEIDALVSTNSGANVVVLVGPTGVGKTLLSKMLIERTARENSDELRRDVSFIPATMIAAPSIGEKSFSWKSFLEILLESLNEPMLEKKSTAEQLTSVRDLPLHMNSKRITISALSLASEKVLRFRRTRYVIVDEAAHMLQGNAIVTQINALKSLSDLSGTKFVLLGSYDLYDITRLNGQLARRCHVVHVPRYTSGEGGGKHHFYKVAEKLATQMSLNTEVDLQSSLPMLMESCVGCVGILKGTLQRAYAWCLRKQNGEWSTDALVRSLLTTSSVKTILQEALDGEDRLAENGSWRLK